MFQQWNRDYEQYVNSECVQEWQGVRRNGRNLAYNPSEFDKALYFEMEAGFPDNNFHLHYHGVNEIVHWWDLLDSSKYRTTYAHGCRPYVKQQGRTLFQNSLMYGKRKSPSDLARVKFSGMVVGPRFFAAASCSSASSSNQVAPSCDAYGCTMVRTGTVYLSVWCNMLPGNGLISGKEEHYEALGWTSCTYVA